MPTAARSSTITRSPSAWTASSTSCARACLDCLLAHWRSAGHDVGRERDALLQANVGDFTLDHANRRLTYTSRVLGRTDSIALDDTQTAQFASLLLLRYRQDGIQAPLLVHAAGQPWTGADIDKHCLAEQDRHCLDTLEAIFPDDTSHGERKQLIAYLLLTGRLPVKDIGNWHQHAQQCYAGQQAGDAGQCLYDTCMAFDDGIALAPAEQDAILDTLPALAKTLGMSNPLKESNHALGRLQQQGIVFRSGEQVVARMMRHDGGQAGPDYRPCFMSLATAHAIGDDCGRAFGTANGNSLFNACLAELKNLGTPRNPDDPGTLCRDGLVTLRFRHAGQVYDAALGFDARGELVQCALRRPAVPAQSLTGEFIDIRQHGQAGAWVVWQRPVPAPGVEGEAPPPVPPAQQLRDAGVPLNGVAVIAMLATGHGANLSWHPAFADQDLLDDVEQQYGMNGVACTLAALAQLNGRHSPGNFLLYTFPYHGRDHHVVLSVDPEGRIGMLCVSDSEHLGQIKAQRAAPPDENTLKEELPEHLRKIYPQIGCATRLQTRDANGALLCQTVFAEQRLYDALAQPHGKDGVALARLAQRLLTAGDCSVPDADGSMRGSLRFTYRQVEYRASLDIDGDGCIRRLIVQGAGQPGMGWDHKQGVLAGEALDKALTDLNSAGADSDTDLNAQLVALGIDPASLDPAHTPRLLAAAQAQPSETQIARVQQEIATEQAPQPSREQAIRIYRTQRLQEARRAIEVEQAIAIYRAADARTQKTLLTLKPKSVIHPGKQPAHDARYSIGAANAADVDGNTWYRPKQTANQHNCAVNAVNAMFGCPVLTDQELRTYTLAHAQAQSQRDKKRPLTLQEQQQVLSDLQAVGNRADVLHWILKKKLGLPVLLYECVPQLNEDGTLGLDTRQTDFLDSLPRKIANIVSGNGATHWTAWRNQDHLDSRENKPQRQLGFAQLLAEEKAANFSAIVLQPNVAIQATPVQGTGDGQGSTSLTSFPPLPPGPGAFAPSSPPALNDAMEITNSPGADNDETGNAAPRWNGNPMELLNSFIKQAWPGKDSSDLEDLDEVLELGAEVQEQMDAAYAAVSAGDTPDEAAIRQRVARDMAGMLRDAIRSQPGFVAEDEPGDDAMEMEDEDVTTIDLTGTQPVSGSGAGRQAIQGGQQISAPPVANRPVDDSNTATWTDEQIRQAVPRTKRVNRAWMKNTNYALECLIARLALAPYNLGGTDIATRVRLSSDGLHIVHDGKKLPYTQHQSLLNAYSASLDLEGQAQLKTYGCLAKLKRLSDGRLQASPTTSISNLINSVVSELGEAPDIPVIDSSGGQAMQGPQQMSAPPVANDSTANGPGSIMNALGLGYQTLGTRLFGEVVGIISKQIDELRDDMEGDDKSDAALIKQTLLQAPELRDAIAAALTNTMPTTHRLKKYLHESNHTSKRNIKEIWDTINTAWAAKGTEKQNNARQHYGQDYRDFGSRIVRDGQYRFDPDLPPGWMVVHHSFSMPDTIPPVPVTVLVQLKNGKVDDMHPDTEKDRDRIKAAFAWNNQSQ